MHLLYLCSTYFTCVGPPIPTTPRVTCCESAQVAFYMAIHFTPLTLMTTRMNRPGITFRIFRCYHGKSAFTERSYHVYEVLQTLRYISSLIMVNRRY